MQKLIYGIYFRLHSDCNLLRNLQILILYCGSNYLVHKVFRCNSDFGIHPWHISKNTKK